MASSNAPRAQRIPTENGQDVEARFGADEARISVLEASIASMQQRIAGQDISALSLVYELDERVFVLTSTDATHIDLLLGIAVTAAASGQPIRVQFTGSVDDVSWSWTPGRVWLGPAGFLTQSPPSNGFDVLIGAAVSPTRVQLDIQDAIQLE